jgi:hypothetical protein
MRITIIFLLLTGVLTGCRTAADCSRPALTDLAQRMANCLSARASIVEVEAQLIEWEYEGEVISANLLTDSPAPELILAYRANSLPYDPQGKLAVLERIGNKWQVAFESPDPHPENNKNGATTLAGNWWFELDHVADLEENGRESVLFHQRWSNITSYSPSYAKLLTADENGVRVLLVEDDFDDHHPTYVVDGERIYSQSNFGNGVAITRTLVLKDDAFVKTAETINLEAAKLSVTLADGTQFVSFDSECGSLCYHQYGLYRIRDGKQFHYNMPVFIDNLTQLRDGHVYVGTGQNIFRVVGDEMHSILSDFAPLPDNPDWWQVIDMEMTSDGEIWVAGGFNLLHFGHEQSAVYDKITSTVTIAPDDSVWALGWDGQADSDCCIFHIQNGKVTTYQKGEALPVSKDLAAQIYE